MRRASKFKFAVTSGSNLCRPKILGRKALERLSSPPRLTQGWSASRYA